MSLMLPLRLSLHFLWHDSLSAELELELLALLVLMFWLLLLDTGQSDPLCGVAG